MGMVAILINGPRLFVQIFNPPLTKGSRRNLKKIGPGISEKFKGVDGRRTDRRQTDDVITIALPEPSAQLS